MVLKKFLLLFKLAVGSIGFTSFTIMLIPFVKTNINQASISLYIVATLFWVGIISNIVFLIFTNRQRKLIERKLNSKNLEAEKTNGIGCFLFFKNKSATVCDIVLFLSAIAIAVFTILKVDSAYLICLCLGILFLSFGAHSYFNGKNYIYYISINQYYKNKECKGK